MFYVALLYLIFVFHAFVLRIVASITVAEVEATALLFSMVPVRYSFILMFFLFCNQGKTGFIKKRDSAYRFSYSACYERHSFGSRKIS